MARIRTIKPEFFTSEDIVSLSPLARLLYIACWCESDREGRLEWKPRTMKLRYFPGDDCNMDTLTAELVDRGLVLPYDVDSRHFAEIPSFAKHQIINNRESASHIPPRVPTREPRVKAEGRKEGKEGKGSHVGASPPLDDSPPAAPPVLSLPLVDGSLHGVSAERISSWKTAFPAVDVVQQLRSMEVWLTANPRNQKTPTGIERFIVSWLTKAQDKAPRASSASQPWKGGK